MLAAPDVPFIPTEWPSVVVQPVLRTERRAEARWEFVVPVAASYEASDETTLGTVVNISASGLLLHMPEAPQDVHVDLVVGDDNDCALLWAKVVAEYVDESVDGFVWHVQVVSADADWDSLVRRARILPAH